MSTVACMMAVDTKTRAQAIQSDSRRPAQRDVNPADDEDTKAPSTMSDEMSCCRSDEMFHLGSASEGGSPKTCVYVHC